MMKNQIKYSLLLVGLIFAQGNFQILNDMSGTNRDIVTKASHDPKTRAITDEKLELVRRRTEFMAKCFRALAPKV